MSIQTAAAMAATELDEAKQALAVAERTKILVDAFIKTGSARVIFTSGQTVEMQPIHTGNKQQDQWNIYYECKRWAALSLRKAERAPEAPKGLHNYDPAAGQRPDDPGAWNAAAIDAMKETP